MTMIVTGAGGFVGRHLVQRLLAAGHAVVGMDTTAGGIPAGARPVVGDICSAEVRAEALADGCTALVHLATVPGGAAEADPAASRRVNIDAMYDLLDAAKAAGDRPRIVYASSIAVFGDPLPAHGVDDQTPLAPRMVYGGHKAMMEVAVAMMHHRGEIEGVSIRLPAILARPKGPSGMKSAFMSDLFHALRAGAPFICPVSAGATIWAQSVSRCADNLLHAVSMDPSLMPATRVVTLPAQRVAMGDLAAEIARQCGTSADLVRYRPDAVLEAAFGAHPPLSTPAADRAGFVHDGDPARLVANALSVIAAG
ncbi:epimerase [Sphingobium sp. Leaf26]|uniref:NAD-dependent epimerase/dehydratase family protein n=1 Tax=Sphingobium sp. Leaf26 TaxID=1735693 RepID=UPI0006FFD53D|nr:NAD-dependent epimerase/dehydratase family protein [Sphingobium sp. Leaf26]KQM97266.1 epimerase [Sphingobium sp. Leaf26]